LFRDDEISVVKKPDETRILVLGDSITFGVSTPKEYTYVERAEGYLAAESQHGRIRLINGGVEGIGLKDEIDILVDQGLSISPDIVVVSFYPNDGNPPDRLAAGLANPGFIRRHSVLAQAIYRAYKFKQYRKGEMEEANMYGWLYIPPPPDWRINRNSLLQYADVAKKD
jgi:lysophospholipase L1-like esterase